MGSLTPFTVSRLAILWPFCSGFVAILKMVTKWLHKCKTQYWLQNGYKTATKRLQKRLQNWTWQTWFSVPPGCFLSVYVHRIRSSYVFSVNCSALMERRYKPYSCFKPPLWIRAHGFPWRERVFHSFHWKLDYGCSNIFFMTSSQASLWRKYCYRIFCVMWRVHCSL